jgi:hypothetical protein
VETVLRFHLDENVDGAIANALRQHGVDVTMPVDVGLIEAQDEEHLQFAYEQQRVVFTHDDDFLKLTSQGISHAGIAYCHPEQRTIGEISRYLCLMSDCLEAGEMFNRVEWL